MRRMFRKNNFAHVFKAVKKSFVLLALSGLFLVSSCYQKFETLVVRSTDEGIIFSHPAMDDALRRGDFCIFGEISVSRRDAADNLQEEMWFVQNTESGFQTSAEPLKKSRIVYGETLPQTRILIEPKPLREGLYRVSGVIGIYNQKRELLRDLSFNDEFGLKADASGKLIVAEK